MKKKLIVACSVILILLYCITIINLMYPTDKSNESYQIKSIGDEWEYKFGDSPTNDKDEPIWASNLETGWNKYKTGQNFDKSRDTILWIKLRIPDLKVYSPFLLCNIDAKGIEAFLDEKEIHKSDYLDGKVSEGSFTSSNS